MPCWMARRGRVVDMERRCREGMQILLASPRGFCAGVDRAIDIVERAIELFGAPIYVRHEVVHNRHVVDRLRAMGARFVEELDEIPDGRHGHLFRAWRVQRRGEGGQRAAASRSSMPPVRWSPRCTWKWRAMRAMRATWC